MSAQTGDKRWTVLELLQWTTSYFSEKGIETARLDAECLLAHALGQPRLGLYLELEKPASPDERARFVELFDGELEEDQSLVMTWLPGTGLEIRIDEDVIDTIAGDDFARAFFEIYFGPKPVDDGMKEDLLEDLDELVG